MKKAFKDTAIGGFLAKVAPSVIDTVGNVLPPVKLLKGLIDGDQFIAPEDRAKLEQMLKEYELEELRMRLDDVSDARQMQVEALKQDDKFSKRFVYWLAAGSLLLGFAYVFWITFGEIPQANQRFADTILGVVIATIITTIYNFFFGSSDGSKKKDVSTSLNNHVSTSLNKQ
jgi:hypothetical protein